MPADFTDNLMELMSIIEQRDHEKLSAFALDVPEKFNWVRDMFEPSLFAVCKSNPAACRYIDISRQENRYAIIPVLRN